MLLPFVVCLLAFCISLVSVWVTGRASCFLSEVRPWCPSRNRGLGPEIVPIIPKVVSMIMSDLQSIRDFSIE